MDRESAKSLIKLAHDMESIRDSEATWEVKYEILSSGAYLRRFFGTNPTYVWLRQPDAVDTSEDKVRNLVEDCVERARQFALAFNLSYDD